MAKKDQDEQAPKQARLRPDTLLSHLGRDPARFGGAVNTPVFRCSTVLTEGMERFEQGRQRRFEKNEFVYGRLGTPTTFSLEEALAGIEGGFGTVLTSSGLAAIACALLAFAEAGGHILVTDSAYEPTRRFCNGLLARFGVETEYYDPLIGAGIADRIRPETKAVFCESPGSLTFEVQDLPAIAAAAGAKGVPVLVDNTWATPLFLRPFELGLDVSIQAATKYVVGHSDAMLGSITAASEELYWRIRKTVYALGNAAGPDDAYLGLRGLRTLSVRLERHQESGLKVARWFQARPEVAQVLHPALPGAPGHELWQRDFTGASGLFSIVLAEDHPREALAAMVDGLELFGIGASWGGYESLVIPGHPERTRSATAWEAPGALLRFHIGLEDPEDLIADLEAGFARLTARAAAE